MTGSGLIHGLRQLVVEAPAFSDLPVHSRFNGPVDLHPVDTKIGAARAGAGCIDERQGQEGTAVVGPAGQNRKPAQIRLRVYHLSNRP